MKSLLTYVADLLSGKKLLTGETGTARTRPSAKMTALDDDLPSALRDESFYWTWPYWKPW